MTEHHDRHETVEDHRASVREDVIGPGISCFTTTAQGRLIEGVVRDISDTGAGITGDTEGLHVGEKVQIVFVVASGQKVRYNGFIKHVEYSVRHYGIQFTGGPEALDPSFDPRASAESHEASTPTCQRCQGAMESGYIVDHTHVGKGREMISAPTWARGTPSRGVTVRSFGAARDGSAFHVETFRCRDCGLLESFARQPEY